MCQKFVKALLIAYPLLVVVLCEIYINYATIPVSNMNVHTIIAVLIFGITVGGLDRDMKSLYWLLPALLYFAWFFVAEVYGLHNNDRDHNYSVVLVFFGICNIFPSLYLSMWILINTNPC